MKKKKQGIMSLMSTGKLTIPTKEELEREFGSPYRPNNPVIMGSLEFIEKFRKAIEDYENNKNLKKEIMESNKFYEIHRSDAIQVLLVKEKNPQYYTNIRLAELLEDYFPEKQRGYIVKEDDLALSGNFLTSSDF